MTGKVDHSDNGRTIVMHSDPGGTDGWKRRGRTRANGREKEKKVPREKKQREEGQASWKKKMKSGVNKRDGNEKVRNSNNVMFFN